MRKRGFSLAELLVAITIFLLILTMGILQMRHAQGQAGTSGLAELIAQELRAARARALSTQSYVAVVFPSENGTRADCQSLYWLEGQTSPKMTRVSDFRGDIPEARIFLGGWPVDSSKLRDATATPQLTVKPGAFNLLNLNVDAWLPTGCRDFAFIFTPAGTVFTNQIPLFDNEYHIAAVTGVEASASTAPTAPSGPNHPPYFQVSKAGEPVTVILDPAGNVRTATGLTACGTGVEILTKFTNPTIGTVPALTFGSNHPPRIDEVNVLPLPRPELLNAGATANVAPDGYATLQVVAHDDDGDNLTCEWTSTPVSGGAGGTFSVPSGGPAAMTYDRARQKWVSSTEWQPPVGAHIGDRFTLMCTVRDGRGGSDDSNVEGLLKTMEVNARGHVVFIVGNNQIYRVNADGTGQQRLLRTDGYLTYGPNFSADGTKVVFASNSPNIVAGNPSNGHSNLYTMNADGSNIKPVFPENVEDSEAVFNRQGTDIIFRTRPSATGGTYQIKRLSLAAGATPTLLIDTGAYDTHANWSPDGTKIVFDALVSGTRSDLFVIPSTGTSTMATATRVTSAGMNLFAQFTSDGNGLLFLSDIDHPGMTRMHTANLSPLGAPQVISPGGTNELDPTFDPAFSQVIFASSPTKNDYSLYMAPYPGLGTPVLTPKQLTTIAGNATHPQWRP